MAESLKPDTFCRCKHVALAHDARGRCCLLVGPPGAGVPCPCLGFAPFAEPVCVCGHQRRFHNEPDDVNVPGCFAIDCLDWDLCECAVFRLDGPPLARPRRG